MALGDTLSPPTGSGSSSTPVTLRDDSMVLPPGATAPVAWKDFIGGYVSKADADARERDFEARHTKARDLLIAEAKRLDALFADATKRAQPQSTPAAPSDPLADVRAKPFVDGETIAQLYGRLEKEGIGPLYQWAQNINRVFQVLDQRLKAFETRVGGFERTRDDEDLRKWIDGVIVQHKLKDAPVIRKLIENYYYSFEPEEGQTREVLYKELPAMIGADLTELRAALRELDKAEADRAREEQRKKIPARGGSVAPTGRSPARPMTPREIAKHFYSGRQAAAT